LFGFFLLYSASLACHEQRRDQFKLRAIATLSKYDYEYIPVARENIGRSAGSIRSGAPKQAILPSSTATRVIMQQ
jgi:hypothetical protein